MNPDPLGPLQGMGSTAYLVLTLYGGEASARTYSEFPLATMGERNRHQILIAKASGHSYPAALQQLHEQLVQWAQAFQSSGTASVPLLPSPSETGTGP
jgi:hypothetical protein